MDTQFPRIFFFLFSGQHKRGRYLYVKFTRIISAANLRCNWNIDIGNGNRNSFGFFPQHYTFTKKLFVAFTFTKNIFFYNSERELYSFVESNVFIFTVLSIRWRKNSIRKEIVCLAEISLCICGEKYSVNLHLPCSLWNEKKTHPFCINEECGTQPANMSFHCLNDFSCSVEYSTPLF